MSDQLIARLEPVWQRSDALFELVAPDALLEQPIPLRQPLLFYVGHLPAFGWNQTSLHRGSGRLHDEFDVLFERGIDPMGVDTYESSRHRWPALHEVIAYRDRARDALRRAWASPSPDDPESQYVLGTILEHELMHHETLLYMIQQLPPGKRGAPPGAAPVLGAGCPDGIASVPAGTAVLGIEPGELPFVWDNELRRHEVEVAGFRIDRTPVTNAQFIEFLEDGGYDREELWTPDGWAWRQRRGISAPPFWTRRDGGWACESLTGALAFEDVRDWPVSVSHAAARAFCRWRGARLPSEVEYHRAAYSTPDGDIRSQPWGDAPPEPTRANVGFASWSPTPVGTHPEGVSAWGVHDLVGDGWEWTRTPFAALPGFEPMPNYPGYSADFFDQAHYVMLGGSWATDVGLVRRSFRNWFQPHYPWVFSKFRCVWPAE